MELIRHDFGLVIIKVHRLMALQPILGYDQPVHGVIRIQRLHSTHVVFTLLGFFEFLHRTFTAHADRVCRRLGFPYDNNWFHPTRRSKRINTTGLHAILTLNHSREKHLMFAVGKLYFRRDLMA